MITEGQFLSGSIIILTIGATILFKKLDKQCPIFFSMIIAFFCSLLFSLFVFQVTRWLDSNETEYYTHWGNIQSIRNSDEVSGRFMLGTGSIEQTEYYYYYYKSSEGYVRGKRPVNQTIIVEDDSVKPQVQVKMKHFESKSGLFQFNDEEQERYKIVVPKGTVVNKFEVY